MEDLYLNNNRELNLDNNNYLYTIKPVHYIGDYYGGGRVFYTWNNGMNGLIDSLNTKSAIRWDDWHPGRTLFGCDTGQACFSGQTNTNLIVTLGYGSNAATICNDLNQSGFTDWYLPNAYELNLLDDQGWISHVGSPRFWTSSESTYSDSAICHNCIYPNTYTNTREGIPDAHLVRPIRQF